MPAIDRSLSTNSLDQTDKDDAQRKSIGDARRADFLFVVLDRERPTTLPLRHRIDDLDVVLLGRQSSRSAKGLFAAHAPGIFLLSLPDRWTSRPVHARLTRVLRRWVLEDAGSSNGTFVNGSPIERTELCDGDVIELGHTILIFREHLPCSHPVPRSYGGHDDLASSPNGWSTLLPSLGELFSRAETIAASPVSVLVRGETGTGKELAARVLHAKSLRKGELVAVNCAALVPSLTESELFGYRRGAFTGANEERAGIVQAAHGGTLFLDEIGDLSLSAQAALLRVLQEGEVLPVGATRPLQVDLRIVAATHRDLDALVRQGRFRADLLARISGYQFVLPPLRERREDIGIILGTLLLRCAVGDASGVRISSEAARALLSHPWPHNIRELEKAITTAVVLAKGAPIERGDLPSITHLQQPLDVVELQRQQELIALLKRHKGNIAAVSREMGKARMQIQRWIQRYGILVEKFRE